MEKNQDNTIIFLLKSMKSEYLHDTMTKGRFCFNHPTVFSKWENVNAAQFDRWEAHNAYEGTYLVYAPIIGEDNGMPIYAPPKKLSDRAIIHMQSNTARDIPICCFRCITQNEISFDNNHNMVYSLGKNADRILHEFEHDAFVIIQIIPFLERMKGKVKRFMAMNVAYHDLLNAYQFDVEEKDKEIVEQLFRKDEKYKWQKEYRIILPPTKESPVFVELGSIEDIAICGKIVDLRE